MSDSSVSSTSGVLSSAWLTTLQARFSTQKSIVDSIPTVADSAISNSLMNKIYDTKAITPTVLNAYEEKLQSEEDESSDSDASSSTSSSDSTDITSVVGNLLDLTA